MLIKGLKVSFYEAIRAFFFALAVYVCGKWLSMEMDIKGVDK